MMAKYSIKELEQLSGIKAHTIRMWEKRYAIINPKRTDTNIRFYSDEDLKKIINVSLLNSNGFKISKIAEMTGHEIIRKVLEISETKNDNSIHINQLILAMINLDEAKFETALSGFFMRYNFEQTITEIVYPFLEKTGVLWQTHNITPAQEHFLSNLIRQKLIVGIDGLPLQTDSPKKAILFLPEKELHEIGLLFCHYLLRKGGYHTIYLGQAVPHGELRQVFEVYHPDMLVTILTTNLPEFRGADSYLKLLSTDFPCAQILVSGQAVRKHEEKCIFERVRIFRNLPEFKELSGFVKFV